MSEGHHLGGTKDQMVVNLVSVALRNLCFPSDLGIQDTFFVLRCHPNEEPFYRSEVASKTCNPPWAPLDSRLVRDDPRLETSSQLVVDVFAVSNPKENDDKRAPENAATGGQEQFTDGHVSASETASTIDQDWANLHHDIAVDNRTSFLEDFRFGASPLLPRKMVADSKPRMATYESLRHRPQIRHLVHREIDLRNLFSLDLSPDIDRVGAAPVGLLGHSQVKSELEQAFAYVPPNSVLVELAHGLYADRDTFEAIHNCSPEVYYAQHKSKTHSNHRESFIDDVGSHRPSIGEDMEEFPAPHLPEETAKLNDSIKSLEQKGEQERDLEKKKNRVQELKKLKASLSEDVSDIEKSLQNLRRANDDTQERLTNARHSLNEMRERVFLQEESLNYAYGRFWDVTVLLTRQQQHLIADLRKIYPIECKEPGVVYTIRGLPLTKGDVDSGQEQRTSTALGYVAHLVVLLSKYLLVPLRYMPQPMASRSTIVDSVMGGDREAPLYWKGSTQLDKFRLGYTMLAHDVLQLLFAVGIKPPNGGHHILECLQSLFFHFYEPESEYAE
eukprot:gb/GECG01009982.1/.p1 GENE.gb/GECG01009982.1/~~gb/GECG01009982.1/.p1  ORF type:complete len:558 (+),score=69.69 gb/GECG01009982.1/:1-1674(+)